jgi:hypothetical protein
MSADHLQKFVDIKAKQTPDDIKSMPLGDGAFAITANGEYKGMYTVPKDPNNALTAELNTVKGRLKYFKEAAALVESGDVGGAVQMLNALGLKVAGEPLSTEDPNTVKSIVGLEVENLETETGKTGDGEVRVIKDKDGKLIQDPDQSKPKPEPKPEPAVEQTSSTPAPKQREVSVDKKGSIYDESGMPRSFVLRGLSKIIPSIVKGGSPAAQKIEQETLEKIQSMASNVPPERIRQLIVALERRKRRFALSPEEEAKVNQELQALNSMLGEGTALASK